ncbi:histidine kinase [Bizionia argentinensis JUB59]|uniref:Histidine kinase n=1 Tax=Bizionia argentinensis JUB59 TaxID=1046627 RepID=G2EGU9_9FLAO|nr:histidine kinase [Bizionia argentinensis]EGV42336.1 histidine kinase [Bizionia argentinensis JUB59]
MCLSGQIIVDAIEEKLVLIDNKDVKVITSDAETSFNTVRRETNWRFYDASYNASTETAIWLKFEIENQTKDTLINYLHSTDHYTLLYKQNNNGFTKSKNGSFVPFHERANQSNAFFTKLEVLPFQKSLIYVKLSLNNLIAFYNSPTIYSEKGYWKYVNEESKNQANSIGFIYFYIISLFTIFIFALVFWLRLRKKLYLYYLGYLFFQLIYGFLVLRSTLAPVGNFFNYIPELAFKLFEPVQFIFIGFYVFFILQLLQINQYDKLLAKALKYLGLFCFIYAVSYFVTNYFITDTQSIGTLFLIIRSIILPINLVLIIWIIYKVKHPLFNYFIIGQTFFFIGAILATYVGYSGVRYIPGHLFNFKESANVIFQIGLLAEVYCFSLALGRNVFILQKDKEKANRKLIDQLQKNQHLQETMNRELDGKVQKKTDELIQLYSEIEREREQKIKDDFTNRIKETEMVALRSQMNPHFIFNSMSAIKSLIMTARNDDAINYLDDFSSLLRGILQNSNHKKITVEEELEILELYLSLEQNRMGPNFNYNIQVDSNEALSQYEIPPLLLQPIVENAIWHGLHPSLKTDKKLIIIFDTTENLKIIIEDNGIGRKESAKKKKLHESMGTTIVQDRLTLYNHLNDHNIRFKITDLEEDETALGTRITLIYDH